MVNLVWLIMLVGGIITAIAKGKAEVVTTALFQAGEQSITIVLEIAAVMMLWMGILKIAEEAGLMKALSRLLKPLVKKLFPELPRENSAMGFILMNISANLLGLGNAATPFGLKAMHELQELNPEKDKASNSMITFLILNTSSVTLIPTLVISLRMQAGSAAPEEIVATTIVATLAGTVGGLLLHKFLQNRGRYGK